MDDIKYMKQALLLAKKGAEETSPNPMVGAVVVKDNKILGKGFHEFFGGPHAEIYALRQAGKKAKGATMYINLEPCGHQGKTPPCAKQIIKNGIKRVVVAMKDPNPVNNGKSLKKLKRAGIQVKSGICEQEAKRINESFVKFITTKMPFVIIKAAQSLDGKIATNTGQSRWISGTRARRYVHQIRRRVDAILVGVETILKDNPLLTARLKDGGSNHFVDKRRSLPLLKQPAKVIVDTKLRTPIDARIFSKNSPGKVIIATTKHASKRKIESLRKKNACVLQVNIDDKGRVDLEELFLELGEQGISSILIEGGGNVIASALNRRLADKVLLFIAPKIIGGKEAKTSVEGEGISEISQALYLREVDVKKIGEDILIEGYM